MGKLNKTISIIGAGEMGITLSVLFNEYQKTKVRLWDRKNDFLFSNLEETIKDSDLVLLAIPSFAVREVCQKISHFPLPPVMMISKGMEKETTLLPFQIVEEVLKTKNILHLAWIGFAKESKKKLPINLVLAAKKDDLLWKFKELFETDWLKIKLSTDLLGVQLAGALKNVMVIGIGLAEALKENPIVKKKLIEESGREMIKLGKVMRAKEETFEGPAGKGDLEVSANPLSRNYQLGRALFGKGLDKVQKDLKEKGITVEGFHTALAVHQLAKKYRVALPIVEEVYKVIYERKNPKLSAEALIKL